MSEQRAEVVTFGKGDTVQLAGVNHTPSSGYGEVLREDHMGVFVRWSNGPAYARPWQLVLVSPGEVTRLRKVIQWLHPDPVPDPTTAQMMREALGERDFTMFCEVVSARLSDGSVS